MKRLEKVSERKRVKPYLNRRIDALPPVNRIRELARKLSKDVYLVGGSIRDLLMGKSPKDIDIVVGGEGEKFARAMGFSFSLKKNLDEFRVILDDYTIDVLGLGEKPIEEDLKRRDFTINSMAIDLITNKFFDPMNGIKDLEAGIIRMNKESNMLDDPIRI